MHQSSTGISWHKSSSHRHAMGTSTNTRVLPRRNCKSGYHIKGSLFSHIKENLVVFGTSEWYTVDPRYSNPNSLGPEPIQISEIFGLVKATAATCVIVTAPYLHTVLGSLGSLSLLHVHRTQNTAPKLSFSTLLIHLRRKT